MDVHKISPKQGRQAQHIKDKLEEKGVGEDHAAKLAYQEVAKEPNTGGHNSGGDAPKHANDEKNSRTGSESGGPRG